jgi:hypothetical protein
MPSVINTLGRASDAAMLDWLKLELSRCGCSRRRSEFDLPSHFPSSKNEKIFGRPWPSRIPALDEGNYKTPPFSCNPVCPCLSLRNEFNGAHRANSRRTTMSRTLLSAAVIAGLAFGGTALAQTATAPNNSADSTTNTKNLPGMAATSSDAGNLGTGASSMKLGTGSSPTGTGVMSPQAPGTTGHGATGANPNSNGGVSQ